MQRSSDVIGALHVVTSIKEYIGFVFLLQNKLFGFPFRFSVGKLFQGVNLIKDDCDVGLLLLILHFLYI